MPASIYKPEFCKEIIEFFLSYDRYENVEVEHYSKGEYTHSTFRKEPLPPPTLAGYAVKLGVCTDTIQEWKKRHPDFGKAVRSALAIQKQFIIDNSMTNISPSAFSIFMMKNNHNWTDRVEQKVETKVTLEDLVNESVTTDPKDNL